MANVKYKATINSKIIYNTADSAAVNSTGRVSFKAPFNEIIIKFTPEGASLAYWETRITRVDDEGYDIGYGIRANYLTNCATDTEQTETLAVNEDNFPYGDVGYRVSLYSKFGDGTWDVQYIFITSDAEEFIPQQDDNLYVLTDRAAPTA